MAVSADESSSASDFSDADFSDASRVAARRSRFAEEGTSHPTPPGDSASAPNAPPYASAGSSWSTDLPARAAALRRGTGGGDGVSRGRRARDRGAGIDRVPSGATGNTRHAPGEHRLGETGPDAYQVPDLGMGFARQRGLVRVHRASPWPTCATGTGAVRVYFERKSDLISHSLRLRLRPRRRRTYGTPPSRP